MNKRIMEWNVPIILGVVIILIIAVIFIISNRMSEQDFYNLYVGIVIVIVLASLMGVYLLNKTKRMFKELKKVNQ